VPWTNSYAEFTRHLLNQESPRDGHTTGSERRWGGGKSPVTATVAKSWTKSQAMFLICRKPVCSVGGATCNDVAQLINVLSPTFWVYVPKTAETSLRPWTTGRLDAYPSMQTACARLRARHQRIYGGPHLLFSGRSLDLWISTGCESTGASNATSFPRWWPGSGLVVHRANRSVHRHAWPRHLDRGRHHAVRGWPPEVMAQERFFSPAKPRSSGCLRMAVG